MGGLLKKMPKTAWTFLIASASIAGIPPLSGFWSKDEIIATTSNHPVFFVFTLLIAFMTAFYMWRLCFLTFFGKPRNQEKYDHAHESPNTMTYPLIFLAVLSVVAGWVGLPWLSNGFASFVYNGEPYHPHFSWLNLFISIGVGGGGIFLAWWIYYKQKISADMLAEKFKPIHKLLYNKYYFDEIYQVTIIDPVMAFGRFMWTFDARVIDGAVNGLATLIMWWADVKMWFDKWIIDGAVNGSGWLVNKAGESLKLIQNGSMQFYLIFVVTIIIIFSFFKFELALLRPTFLSPTVILIIGIVLLSILSKMMTDKNKKESETKSETDE
jgi:NADH-quinone oxidoreductase subunit L